MRARMRTLYTIGAIGWRGDCPRWASEGRLMGLAVTETRALWVGPRWDCPSCRLGHHR